MKNIGGPLILQAVLIVLTAIFTCAETAVLSVNEAKITKLEESGSKKAKRLRKIIENPAKFLSTVQVALTVSGFLASAFAAEHFSWMIADFVRGKMPEADAALIDTVSMVAVTLILSYFTLVIGVLAPRSIASKPLLSFMLETLGHLPCEDESFLYENMEFTAKTLTNDRVTEVIIHILDEEDLAERHAENAAEEVMA